MARQPSGLVPHRLLRRGCRPPRPLGPPAYTHEAQHLMNEPALCLLRPLASWQLAGRPGQQQLLHAAGAGLLARLRRHREDHTFITQSSDRERIDEGSEHRSARALTCVFFPAATWSARVRGMTSSCRQGRGQEAGEGWKGNAGGWVREKFIHAPRGGQSAALKTLSTEKQQTVRRQGGWAACE